MKQNNNTAIINLAQDNNSYTLRLNLRQANIVAAALDTYSRIGMGQLQVVADLLCDDLRKHETDTHPKADCLFSACYAMKRLLGLSRNSSFGIASGCVGDRYKIAWDINGVVRRTLAESTACEKRSVWNDELFPVVRSIPLAICECVKTDLKQP